ncbi:hypothetical protein DD238_005727 [Peronospora effusa]|uniref:PDZ domain-containing protein n=1 Tax=Peronospora effusa TaxID=542832 RepID=A0A3M6VFH0_9STRA|nr:hypothetical protein DD238_005727 [Peronospora effusa]RQM14559.1 hypothetical protein DD237_006194 [Peronospora effusa]
MKKMSRKNFRGGPLFSSQSSNSTASHSNLSSPGIGGSSVRRATWADKIREKLPPLGENEYEVLWERGVLGVIFLESEKDGIPYISKATESCISSAVSQGDILKFVNVVRSKDHSFSDFFKILATMKKPVLLRFERLSASTPSSDEDDTAQQFNVQRSNSTNALNNASQYARQNVVPHVDDADLTHKMQRANSVSQKDRKPSKVTRGAFWRATGAKEPGIPGNSSQAAGPHGKNGGSDRTPTSHGQRRGPSNKDYQVSPQDATLANTSGSHSSVSPLGPHEYQVYWETGPLGLFFGENRLTNLPVVTRLPSANPVVRRAVAVNDTLVSANGIRSADYTFEAFFGRLQQMNKPVRLVFRRRQPTDQAVIIKQGEQQQQQRHQNEQQQRQQQEQQQQLQQRQQQMREQEQKRELYKLREQQEREQQQLREQEQKLREQQLREQQQREQQREQQIRERKREQELRELQQQQRELKQFEEQQRQQSVTLGTSQSSSSSPAEGITPYRNRALSSSAKCAAIGHGHTPPPSSPVMLNDHANTRQRDLAENVPSTNYEVSPKASLARSSANFGRSPSASPNMGSSPKVSSSPLASPISPIVETEITDEASDLAPPSLVKDADEAPFADFSDEVEKVAVQSPKRSIFENVCGNRSRNSSEEQRQNQKSPTAGHEEEPVLSPVSTLTHLSPTEPWDLPEQISPPKILQAWAIDVDEDVDVGVSLSPSAAIDMDHVVMAKEADFAVEAELADDAELTEGTELLDEAEFVEAELAEEDGPAEEVDMLGDVEMGIAVEEAEPEVAEISESGSDQNTSPWDLEPESDGQKTHHHSSNVSSLHDEAMSSSGGSTSVDNAAETSKVDFADASDPSDEFSQDPDISRDIDSVESDIMMREAPKSKMDSANVPKPNKSSLSANLAKYKKKGKTGRGVAKLPALSEEDALTVPLVAPNAVNTTIQVRGRPKPKLTMADTPDSTTFLIKWKENRSIGLQLKEVRFAKGTYPLVMSVCHEPCCELLRHVCVGDVIVEINGRNTSTMGVKKTVNFLKTCTKTTLMKIRHGPAFVNQRVSAAV